MDPQMTLHAEMLVAASKFPNALEIMGPPRRGMLLKHSKMQSVMKHKTLKPTIMAKKKRPYGLILQKPHHWQQVQGCPADRFWTHDSK